MERNSIAEARAVRDLLIVGMVSDALRVCSALGYSANPLGAGLFIAAKFLLICGVPFLLWRSGRAHSAGLMMIAGGMVINTAYLWAFGGLHSSGLVVLVTIPIMAAFLQGVRGALVASAWSGLNLLDRKSTRLNSSHSQQSRMPSSA